MKRLTIYFLLLFTISFNNIYGNERYVKANSLFADGKYEDAASIYEELLNSGLENGSLYYNLGNSYYKLGNLPKAIINFERAKLLNPQDKDVKYNLEICSSQITDKLDTIGEFFLITWFKSFRNMANSDMWAIISIITFIITVLSIALFLFARSRGVKQIFFYLGVLTIIISIITNIFSFQQKKALTNRNFAIIFSPSVTIKSSPSQGGTELFILHEGTKVKVLETVGDWSRVQISDGNEGWAPSTTIEVI